MGSEVMSEAKEGLWEENAYWTEFSGFSVGLSSP